VSDASGPGAIVQGRREALGLTRQDVADSLNLSVRAVGAIESENWQELPGPAFIRGYLRAYAKLLEIDGEALAGAFEANGGAARVQSLRAVGGAEARNRGVGDLLQRHPGAVLGGAVAVVICAVAVVLLAVWPQKTHGPAASTQPSNDAGTPHQTVLLATKTPSVDATKINAPTAAGPPADGAASAVAGGESRATAAAMSHPTPVKDASGARRITPSGDDRLSFTFAEDCWVDIKDAQGTNLFSELGKSGATLELIGHPPFRITLGNAPAVTLLFNSEHVTLAPHTRNNVGTLVLGQ
jgi:cytoskeleton protein RodZ